jgi:hypothetical protein
VQRHWDSLAAQAAAYYLDSQVEHFLEVLASRECCSFERSEPLSRHFGTPEFALHLSWDHYRVASVQVAKVIDIYMGYAGTLLIEGHSVTILLRHEWQRDRSLVQQALEMAYLSPRIETWLTDLRTTT